MKIIKNKINDLTEDNQRIREERKAYKEENHRLMKQIIQMEEAANKNEREYEQKLKSINHKLTKLQNAHDTSSIENELNNKTQQVKQLIEKLK